MPERENVYVYALTGPGLPPRLTIRGHSLVSLNVERVSAVLERRHAAPPSTVEQLADQHAVVETLADRTPAVLPVRFGAWMSREALRAEIRRRAGDIEPALELVRGRRQMTIRVFGHRREAGESSLSGALSGTEFLVERRRLAHLIPYELSAVRDVTDGLTVAERVEAGEGQLLVTVFHLVPYGQIASYRERASTLQEKLTPLRVKVTGPWPAFAFSPGVL